jgi:3-dehydroquinate synthase
MVGAFYQPKLVYMNMSTLLSLDTRLFNSGFGEIIKHGLIKDKQYYQWLKDNVEDIKNRKYSALEEMIAGSCKIKKNVVELDPTEKGDRALLNFGHTLGHAIEKQMNFKLYHGECVVLGMIAALKICEARKTITTEEYEDALRVFKEYEFPVSVDGISISDVMDAGKIKFILLKSVGDAYIDTTVSDDEMASALDGIIL